MPSKDQRIEIFSEAMTFHIPTRRLSLHACNAGLYFIQKMMAYFFH